MDNGMIYDTFLGHSYSKWMRLLNALADKRISLDELILQIECEDEYQNRVSFLESRLRRIQSLCE